MFTDRVIERFFTKFNSSKDGCWEWTASLSKSGYGYFNTSEKRPATCRLAHRVMWQITYGEDPRKLFVCHKCDNPKCVRPSHLFLGTQKDNMTDCAQKGRHPRNKSKYLPEGERHHYYNQGKKITRETAAEIRASAGTNKALGAKYGVDPSLISRIKTGAIWR